MKKYSVDLTKLASLNLFQLREVGFKIGVRSPTSLKVEELRSAIISIVKGEVEPYTKVKSGRPHSKELIPDTEWDKIIGFDSQSLKKFNPSKSSILHSPKFSSITQENIIYSGYIEIVGHDKYFFPCKAGEIYIDVFSQIDANIPHFNTLRNGDLINCLINFENNVPVVSKIISINGIEPSKLVRPIFEEMKCSSLDEPIKFTLKNLDFLNNICQIRRGQRVMILGQKSSGQNFLCNCIAKDMEATHSIVYLSICKKPEEKVALESSDYFFTTFDAEARNISFYFDLLAERIKRLCELGKDVVLIIDDIVDLMSNLKELIPEHQHQTFYMGIIQQLKRLLANSFYSQNGSITIILAGSSDSSDSQFVQFCETLDGLCNTHIKLNRTAYIQGKDEFFDPENTYTEVVRTI